MRNFIFVSPHFPVNYRNFCIQLHANGVNVLGIGDTPYDSLDYTLQGALTEYYFSVSNTERSMGWRAITSTGWSRMRDCGKISISPE